MRLNRYIIEATRLHQNLTDLPAEEIAKRIKKSSGKYLKLLGGKKPLYKGLEAQYDSGERVYVGMKKVRQKRIPLATPLRTFKFVNSWLHKKGWARRDNSAMFTSNKSWANYFGNAYYVFPKGSCKYTWMEAKDFNDTPFMSGNTSWDIDELVDAVENKDSPEKADELMSDYFHGNKGFDEAYKDGNEIWFDCKEYYFVYYDGMPAGKQKEFKEAFKKIGVNL